MIVWLHNFIQYWRLNPEYKIRCGLCREVQNKEKSWKQKCNNCENMMYNENYL